MPDFTANADGILTSGTEAGDAALAIKDNAILLGSRARQSNYAKTTDPGVSDDGTAGWMPGSFWLNATSSPPVMWQCVHNNTGAALWQSLLPATSSGTGLSGVVLSSQINAAN